MSSDRMKILAVKSLVERLKEQRAETEKLELAMTDTLIGSKVDTVLLNRVYHRMVNIYQERFALEQQIRQGLVDFLKENKIPLP